MFNFSEKQFIFEKILKTTFLLLLFEKTFFHNIDFMKNKWNGSSLMNLLSNQ